MKFKFKYLFLILILVFSCIDTNIAYSNWYIDSDTSSEITIEPSKDDNDVVYKKVAYTRTNNINTYYTSIESALANTSSGEIIVIPGTNPTITKNCTIKSGVTLTLPYDDNGDGTYSDYTNLENQSNNGFADKDATAVATNRKSLVTIAEGITLANNGTLNVAGKVGVGNGNQRPSGFTLGSYSEILMNTNSKIENNGAINLYGYIKEKAKDNGSVVENTSSGSIKMPFTIYDFRGGTYSSNAYSKDSMPFSYFDFPNCHVKQIYNFGAKLTGIALLYASSSYYSSELLALATDADSCLFKMSSDCKVTMKYESSNFGYTTADVGNDATEVTANYTEITIDGDLSLASFTIKVSWYTFNSSAVECPICYKYQITQNTGTLNVSNKMKFLSGSSLTIAEGAKCVVNAGTTFYEGYTPQMTTGSKVHSPQKMGRAKLIVNGELTINSSFGGLINSENVSGTVITGSDFVDNYLSQEYSEPNRARHIEYTEAYKLIDSIPSTFRLEKNQTYILGENLNYWNTSSNIDITSFTLDNPSGTSSSKAAKSYTVSALYNYTGVTYSSSNIICNWQVFSSSSSSGTYTIIDNPDSTMLSVKDNIATFTTPAATSNSVYYKLICTISFQRVDDSQSNLSITSGIYEAYYSNDCVLPTALILMADGSYKEAGKIRQGDEVLSFNHETGNFIKNKIIINSHINEEARVYEVVTLKFENNNKTSLIDEHAYFDVEENKYVYLNKENAISYIGHRFIFADKNNEIYSLKLEEVTIENMLTKLAAPVSAYHLNVIVDDMLSIEGGIDGLFNFFEYDSNTLAYDKEKMEADIEKYGLADYELFSKYFPYEVYNEFLPCKYFNIACDKGLLTWEIIEEYISKWGDNLMENIKQL